MAQNSPEDSPRRMVQDSPEDSPEDSPRRIVQPEASPEKGYSDSDYPDYPQTPKKKAGKALRLRRGKKLALYLFLPSLEIYREPRICMCYLATNLKRDKDLYLPRA